jgi:hypothetical protein
MLEVLSILTIATVEIKQGATSELILCRNILFYLPWFRKVYVFQADGGQK